MSFYSRPTGPAERCHREDQHPLYPHAGTIVSHPDIIPGRLGFSPAAVEWPNKERRAEFGSASSLGPDLSIRSYRFPHRSTDRMRQAPGTSSYSLSRFIYIYSIYCVTDRCEFSRLSNHHFVRRVTPRSSISCVRRKDRPGFVEPEATPIASGTHRSIETGWNSYLVVSSISLRSTPLDT